MGIVSNLITRLDKWYNDVKITINQEDSITSKILLKKRGETIGECYLKQFPGCCGIGILTRVNIWRPFTGIGYGQLLTETAITEAKKQHYTILQATTNHSSPDMEHILLKKGFVIVNEFVNTKTDNLIKQYQLCLQSK